MYDDFYNEEGLTPTQIEKKRKNNIKTLVVETGFVYNNKLLYPYFISPKDTELIAFKYRIEDEFNYKNHKEIYGAIWTKKGLIYVAKVESVSPDCEINWELNRREDLL